ncbi:MAG: SRPBCC domain-containing protein, partial [Mycobacteriales bacterium]
MSDQKTEVNLGDVSKTVTVPVPAKEAFRVFIEEPMDWLPPGHKFLADADLMAIEPHVSGRFYERNPQGTEAIRGVVTEWNPPHRLVMTWRIDGNWQPIPDDEMASFIELSFTEQKPGVTQVVLT